MATRRQTQLMKDIRRTLRERGFEGARFTTGWNPHNRRGGSGTQHPGFKLLPNKEEGDSIIIKFVHSMLMPWKHTGPGEKMRICGRHLEWLNKYQPALEAAGFELVKLFNEPFERPYAVWKRKAEVSETVQA